MFLEFSSLSISIQFVFILLVKEKNVFHSITWDNLTFSKIDKKQHLARIINK